MAVRTAQHKQAHRKSNPSLFEAIREDRRAEARQRRASWKARQHILKAKVVTLPFGSPIEMVNAYDAAVEMSSKFERSMDLNRAVFIYALKQWFYQ